MKLEPSPKIFENYKCEIPENTIKKIEEGFQKLGLSLEYKPKTVKAEDVSIHSGFLVLKDFGFSTVGKGTSDILAKASAYAEMAERVSSGQFFFHTVTFKMDEYYKLLKDILERKFLKGFLEKNSINLDEQRQISEYIEGKLTNDQLSILKNQSMFNTWVDSYSFIHEDNKKIPIKFVESVSGTSGIAAGNTYPEALSQAICEVFERYATYKILLNKTECPTIDLNSINDGRLLKCLDMFKSMNIEIIIKDFTLGNKMPVIGVLFINHNLENSKNQLKKDYYYKMIDSGSHLNINEAILRCFTERLQEYSKDEFMYWRKSDLLYDFWTEDIKKNYENKGVGLYDKDFFTDYEFSGDLSFLEKGECISLDKLRSIDNNDCLADFKALQEICRENNWDLQAIDYTHRVLKFPTVRVIIPPLSTTHHKWVLRVLTMKDDVEKFNFFYGIKDFLKYSLLDNEWINDKDEIRKLIQNLEDYLSKNPSSYRISMRLECFHYIINLFRILAFSNLAIKKHDEALKYFKILIQLNDSPPFYSEYFNLLLNPGYNPDLFSSMINLIQDGQKNNNLPDFQFQYNPFKPQADLNEFEPLFDILINNLSKSYFID